MSIEECYKKFGGDYQDVMQRLPSESLIERFLKKFLDDKSYQNIVTNLETDELDEAFRAAHTLKGLCQNLGLDRLYQSSRDVTEALRDGKNDVTESMLKSLQDDYELTVSAIREL